jgi:hypothetical protein
MKQLLLNWFISLAHALVLMACVLLLFIEV